MKLIKKAIPYFLIAGLAVLMALSYQLFVVRNNFAPAGLNGVATMLQYKTGFSIGYASLIINLPLSIFAFFLINKRYAVLSFEYSLVYSVAFLIFQRLGLEQFQYDANGHNTIFPVILSGVIGGFVYGVCFAQNASSGGIDIVSKYISIKNPQFNFFFVNFIFNMLVAAASFFVYATPDMNGKLVYDYNPVCLSMMYSFISSVIGNYIIRGGKTAIKFTIVTEHPEEIAREISEKLQHGSTKLDAVGTYMGDEKAVLICVVNKHQVVDLKGIISKYDGTFSFHETVGETYGNFKRIR